MLVKPTTTIENWVEYCEMNSSYPNPVGFITGTYETCCHIEDLLEKTQSYEELKQELTLYLKNRESFIGQAENIYKALVRSAPSVFSP